MIRPSCGYAFHNPNPNLDDIALIVSNLTGICKRSVYNVLKEYKSNKHFSAPKTNQNRKNIIDLLDDADKNAIRRKVHAFYFKNELPTIDEVLSEVNNDPQLPNFKRTSLYKLMKKINFKYQRRGRNSMLIDKDEIVL